MLQTAYADVLNPNNKSEIREIMVFIAALLKQLIIDPFANFK